MTHAWYSHKHACAYPAGLFREINGSSEEKIAATFTCSDFERGSKHIKEKLSQFDDYRYIGVVGECMTPNEYTCLCP